MIWVRVNGDILGLPAQDGRDVLASHGALCRRTGRHGMPERGSMGGGGTLICYCVEDAVRALWDHTDHLVAFRVEILCAEDFAFVSAKAPTPVHHASGIAIFGLRPGWVCLKLRE